MAKGWYYRNWRRVEDYAIRNERSYEQRRRVEAAYRLLGRPDLEAERRLLWALLREPEADEQSDFH